MALTLNDVKIEYRESDNYVNATQLCKAGGKKFSHWYALASTKKYIEVVEKNLSRENVEAGITASTNILLIDIIKGNATQITQGTWVHPDIATQLAQWISPEFAYQVSRWIRELLATGSVSIDSKKTDEELVRLQNENAKKDKALADAAHVIEEKDKALEQSKQKNVRLTELTITVRELKCEEVFYIATTNAYSRQNRFKYGGIANINELYGRLATYNTGRAEGDLFYYVKIVRCHSYKQIEANISTLAHLFKDKIGGKKEMLYLRYNSVSELVDFVSENCERGIEFINQNCSRFVNELVEDMPVVPEPLALGDYIEIKKQKNGKTTTHKIDVSTWCEQCTNDLIKKMINQYAENKYGIDYDFDEDKNRKELKIIWKDFSQSFGEYYGTKTMWRGCLKSMTTGIKKIKVRWVGADLS